MPVALEPRTRVSRAHRIRARLAVSLAKPLSRCRPRQLRRLLRIARTGARPAGMAQASAARAAVVSVSVRCAGQGCLERSIATALFCRFGGVWPVWCTGVRMEPFRAHAWVEVDGTPVGEREEMSVFAKTMEVP